MKDVLPQIVDISSLKVMTTMYTGIFLEDGFEPSAGGEVIENNPFSAVSQASKIRS